MKAKRVANKFDTELVARPHDAIWKLLRAAFADGRSMTQPEILSSVNADRVRPVKSAEVLQFLRKLEAAGAVTREVKHKAPGRWRLTKDRGEQTPIETEAGLKFGVPALEQRVWKAARVLKRFDLVEITRAAAGDSGEVRRYLDILVAGGFCRTDDSAVRWRFVEAAYSGPIAPALAASFIVIDFNTGAATAFGLREHLEA